MLLTVPSVRPAPVFSKIDKATILSSFKPAAQSEYVLSDDERTLTKIGPADSLSRSFEVTGKPRPGAKCFMRVKVNGSSYSVIVISPELITATNHVAWTTGSLPANVWIVVKVEHVSGQTYKYTVVARFYTLAQRSTWHSTDIRQSPKSPWTPDSSGVRCPQGSSGCKEAT